MTTARAKERRMLESIETTRKIYRFIENREGPSYALDWLVSTVAHHGAQIEQMRAELAVIKRAATIARKRGGK
jgi:hypothetical protein